MPIPVKTGMPVPPVPMGGTPPPPMPPMGGPGTFPVPQGNPFAPMPPMPLAGSPTPPTQPPMAQQGSNAPRRKRFGDSLESMMSRNMFAQPQPQRPLPMPQRPPQMMPQQRMVAPNTPMMRTPTPRPMREGGIVQYMKNGGSAKPNMREFMDATGATAAEASQALYGSVGSNQDIRDWDAIMSSDDPLEATRAATAQMYGSGSAIATDERFYDEQGNYDPTAVSYGGTSVGASTGGPKLKVGSDGNVYITGSDGLPLTGLTAANAASFGISQDQINAAVQQGGKISGDYSNAGFNPEQTYDDLLTGFNDLNTGSTGSNDAGSDQMIGDIGTSAVSNEEAAIFGPNINIPQKISQFVQDPVTKTVTTTAGPTMTAVSPIGAINLPARPIDLNIFDYLSDPVYGSFLDDQVETMAMGGIVGELGPITNDSRARLGDIQYFDNGGGVNTFDPDTNTYQYGDSSFTMGNTYGDEELPASVAYSKQVQENREAQGLPVDESSAWSLYQKGEHWTQKYQAQEPVEEAEEPVEVIEEEVIEQVQPVDTVDTIDTVETVQPVVNIQSSQPPINYDNFTGDVGSITSGYPEGSQTYEQSALFGPRINIPKYESKFVQNPVTNTITTTAGPIMTAVSPIGAINLPASPIDFNIFDYLVEPVYGSINDDDDDFEEFEDGGIVQYFSNGGNANAQAAASMMSAGIGNVGGKAITSSAQSVQDRFSSAAAKRRKKRRRKRKAREEAARLAAEQAATEAALAAQQNNPNIAGPMESAIGYFGSSAASSLDSPEVFIPPSGGINATPPGFGAAPPPPVNTGMSEGLEILNEMQGAANLQSALSAGIDATPPGFGSVPPVGSGVTPASAFASNLMNIEQPDRSIDREIAGSSFDDAPALTQGVIPSEVFTENIFSYDQDQSSLGLGDNRDDTQVNLGAGTDPSFPKPQRDPYTLGDLLNLEVGMSSGFDDTPQMGTTSGFSYFPEDTTGVMPPVIGEKDDSFAESMFVDEITNPYAVGGGFDVTAPKQTDEGTRFGYPEDKPLVPLPQDQFGNQPTNTTGVDAQADQYRPSVNAAEAAYLQEALKNMDDPNFAEQVINKIIKNLTLGMFDPDDPQKRADAQAILKAYQDTGKFVYDTEENAIDLSTEEGLKQLEELTKGAGIEPTVIGVEAEDGSTVGFDDGTGFQNIMGDYNPVFSEDGQVFSGGSDTLNTLTGSTDVFSGDDTAPTITTSDDNDSDEPDTGFTTDEDGNIICNTEGYVHNPETNMCEPPKEEEEGESNVSPSINIGGAQNSETFDDILKRVVVAAPNISPISANVQPMQQGGMAGLNRAADNFLQALAG